MFGSTNLGNLTATRVFSQIEERCRCENLKIGLWKTCRGRSLLAIVVLDLASSFSRVRIATVIAPPIAGDVGDDRQGRYQGISIGLKR